MTVEETVRLWPKLVETGLRLGAPAHADTNSLWVESFMAKTKAKVSVSIS